VSNESLIELIAQLATILLASGRRKEAGILHVLCGAMCDGSVDALADVASQFSDERLAILNSMN